jgi:N-acetyl-anhydromuramyl-L-alanine amidase AmpD
MPALELLPTIVQVNSPHSGDVIGKREGVMIHFDDSTEDKWAIAWFRDPACKVSYNRLYLDNGDVASICSMTRRAYHAGLCLGGNANSRYYGLSAATDARHPVTQKQFESMVKDATLLFRYHGWRKEDVTSRIVGHDEKAIFGPENTSNKKLWGKLGRKIDPTGLDKTHPIINIQGFRAAVALSL